MRIAVIAPVWFPVPPTGYGGIELVVSLLADGLVWVAEADGALVGFAACEAFDDALHLWELAVRRECQGRGVGRVNCRRCAGHRDAALTLARPTRS